MSEEQIQQIKEIYAEEAQSVYDIWQLNGEADDLFGSGGICDAIAEAAVEAIRELGYEAGGMRNTDIPHTWFWVELSDEAYEFDIPYSVYETMSWEGSTAFFRKLADVEFSPDQVEHREYSMLTLTMDVDE